jgi:pheromone shutdown-related protein TraB
MPELIFVGTSHIAAQSITTIKKAFLTHKPNIIAIELDAQRLQALLTKQKPSYSLAHIKTIGFTGYLFAVIGGLLQRKLGKMVGIDPGADMKQAALLAQHNNLPLLLIDRPITLTLQRLSKMMTRKEKWRLVGDILFGRFRKQGKIHIDLSKLPEEEIIVTLLTQLKERYPSFYTVLVHERNHYMTKQIFTIAKQNPDKKILVVVGAGHLKGIQEILSSLQTKHNA